MKLPPGKLPINILEDVVFKNLGVIREEVVLGPTAGFDGAVIDVRDKSLIVSMDPVTGAIEWIGWLTVTSTQMTFPLSVLNQLSSSHVFCFLKTRIGKLLKQSPPKWIRLLKN